MEYSNDIDNCMKTEYERIKKVNESNIIENGYYSTTKKDRVRNEHNVFKEAQH